MMLARVASRYSPRVLRPVAVATFTAGPAWVPGIGKGKTSTGLVGLAVDHDAVPKMIEKYQALLDKMAASDMPESATYRSTLEKICRHRIQACLDHPEDPEKVEELCNCGQVEELVEQADSEMMVLDMYLDRRFWEQVSDDVPHDINIDPTEDIYPDDHDENLVMPKPGNTKQGN